MSGSACDVCDLDEDDGGGKGSRFEVRGSRGFGWIQFRAGRFSGKFDPVEDADAGDGAGFCAEPALAAEVCGEEFLNEAEPRAGEQIAQAARGEVERALFGLHHGATGSHRLWFSDQYDAAFQRLADREARATNSLLQTLASVIYKYLYVKVLDDGSQAIGVSRRFTGGAEGISRIGAEKGGKAIGTCPDGPRTCGLETDDYGRRRR